MGEAFQTAQQLDHPLAVSDSIAALEALRELPEVTGGKAGVLGFCLGGTLAFEVAVAERSRHGGLLLRIRDPRDARPR